MFSCQRELRVLRDDMASYHELIREVSTARLKLLPSLIFPCSIVIWGPERGGRYCKSQFPGTAILLYGKESTGRVWKQAR
eukprot:scaffold2244_cov19-Tisochrysis_lutea.AAC.1